MTTIPLLVPRMPDTDRLIPYLRQIDQNRLYTNFGPLSRELERRLVDDLDGDSSTHVTTVSNCTVGLELALQACGLEQGARVLIPAITFVATATAVIRVGMVPVLSDVATDSWLLSPELARHALKQGRIDAVMPVATFGCPHDMEQWDAFIQETGIPVIIDAAGAYGNQKVGGRADVVFSFHATKSFGAAEGGAVFSSDPKRILAIRQLANFGIDTSIAQLVGFGTNGKMSEYHCAIGLASFDEWEETKRERRSLHRRYSDALHRACPTVRFQSKPSDGIYPLLPVLLPEGVSAADVSQALSRAKIETRRWYSPGLHTHPALRDAPRSGSLTVADDIGTRILGLPFFINISDEQINRVCSELSQALATTTETMR
ncbi:DegT/DnrJ/EryC1/StrS family aminotransferase [Lysobacter arenosi]|uniref:DegT/DnrJ/EryC1/StrS family aminotransferase n=1 Tax=Lysobacter arenosi TaxID=2795387 RepID=A0ABX7R6M4_9GAMM|nr:DegT/DnrJ/EryC1/StrS family aminotransferase [Lysobacter arenosi]QSX73635.1 DegT/DnrJ/EryC1/StrS family aminotransferase [Lysobacter arenosi]